MVLLVVLVVVLLVVQLPRRLLSFVGGAFGAGFFPGISYLVKFGRSLGNSLWIFHRIFRERKIGKVSAFSLSFDFFPRRGFDAFLPFPGNSPKGPKITKVRAPSRPGLGPGGPLKTAGRP